MHLKNINIVSSFNITGRGKALVTDLDYDLNCNRFKKGDTLRHDDKIYEILSVEVILSIGPQEHVAFLTKEITIGDLIDKKKKQQPTLVKDISWWERVKIKWCCSIKPFLKRILKLN